MNRFLVDLFNVRLYPLNSDLLMNMKASKIMDDKKLT